MDKEEFYRAVDKIFGVETYVKQLPYKRRWGQRKPGNGRYSGYGVVWWYGPKLIRVVMRNPKTLNRVFYDVGDALRAIEDHMKAVNMKYFLLTFSRNWADEFDVDGFKIVSEDEKAHLHELIAEHGNHEAHFWFGTNEGWEGDTLGDMFSSFKFTEITLEEKAVLEKLFPDLASSYSFMRSFGVVPDLIGYALENDIIEDEED
jgi:hypothetical protein